MKKHWGSMMGKAAAVMMALSLTACSSAGTSGESAAEPAKSEAAAGEEAASAVKEGAEESAAAGEVSLPEGYPEKDITILVTFEAGGTTDIAVRTFAKYMQKQVPVRLNVLNISGAGGNTGLAEAVKHDPDGYYFVIQSGPFPMNAALGKVQYTYEDFEHVGMMFQSYMALAVNKDSSYETFDDFKTAVQAAEPGTFKYGVYAGSPMESIRMTLEDSLDVKFHIVDLDQSKSTELLAGRVEAYSDAIAQLNPYVESGNFRILGVFADERLASQPDIPAMKEFGVSNVITEQCYGMWAPKGTDSAVLDYMNQVIEKAYEDPELQAEMDSLGYEARVMSRQEYTDWLTNIYTAFKDYVSAQTQG